MKYGMNGVALACVAMAAVLVSGLGGCASGGGATMTDEGVVHQVTAADRAATEGTEPIVGSEVVLFVNGLGCPQCATNIEPQIKRIPGVRDVRIDLGSGTATVSVDPATSPKPTPARFKKAVEDGGLSLVKIQSR